MTDPQCPHIKSSPPVPDILLSVRRIERFSVVIGPTGIMSIVAISSPTIRQLRGIVLRKYGPIKPIAPYVSLLPRVTAAHRPGTMRMAAWKASGTLDRGSFHAAAASSAALSQMTGAMLSRPQLALANPDGHRWNLPRKPGSHRTPRWRG